MKKMPIEDNPGGANFIFDVFKRENAKKNKMKVILGKNCQESKDYFLYHSISKF